MPCHRSTFDATAALVELRAPQRRTLERFITFVATPDLEQQAALLSNNSAVLWLGETRSDVNIDQIIHEISYHTKVAKDYFCIVPHFPEDNVVRFMYHHYRNLLTAAPGRFGRGRLDIHASNWRASAQADVTKLNYHINLSLMNVPLRGWGDELVSRIIGDDCVLHYFDDPTLQKMDTPAVKLWAWWLDKPLASGALLGSKVMGRTGLECRVLIHMDLLEDFTPDSTGVLSRHPLALKPFCCQQGVIDGENERRERARPSHRDNGYGRHHDNHGP
ncbi:hypothetical protein D1007_02573 [Hordeum vulgare]|nr:hypothetical protein D1007_02573 [Hordeum vulgare]